MNKRIAKKIIESKDKLKYTKQQVRKAEAYLKKAGRRPKKKLKRVM